MNKKRRYKLTHRTLKNRIIKEFEIKLRMRLFRWKSGSLFERDIGKFGNNIRKDLKDVLKKVN